ncbi:MAG: condensation domain-containing protein, partial [Polyangiales bacterium]
MSVHDGFFELGGHSLLGTQLIARLRKVLEVDLALSDLFEAPTVAGLAARLESGHAADGTRATAIGILDRDGSELPLSFAEERLWFLDQMGAGAGYNMPMAIRARGALDIAALEQSIATIAQRHETLRTSFPVVEGRPRISIADRFDVPLEVIDRTGLSDAERDAEINRLATTEAHVPFDLDRGPLLRAKLIQLAEDDHVLVVTFHHIVSDGWSAGVFARELMAFYDGFVQGHEPRVATLPVQYVDYAAWQRSWLRGDELDRQFAYWEEELRDLPVLSLPTDRPRPTVASFAGDSSRFELSPEIVTAVHDLGRREGVTPAMLLLGAFQVLLARYSGQDDVAVGSPIANRVHPDVENLIGFFVNTLVLRTNLSGDPTFVEVLRRVRKASLGAYDHQDLHFERLVDKLEPERDMSRNPLFQVAFMLQNMPRVEIELPGMAIEQAPLDFSTVRVDLELYLHETDGRISGRA